VRFEKGLTPPQLTKGCGERHKLHGDGWGEAPAANGFLFFGSMKRILAHKCE